MPGRLLDDNDMVLVEYEGGAVGTSWTGRVAIGHDNDLAVRIYGENSSVEWEDSGMERVFGGTEARAFTRKINFSPSDVAFDDAIKNQ